MKLLTDKEKQTIDLLHGKLGHSGRHIAKVLGRPKSTINDYIKGKKREEVAPPSGVRVLSLDIETAPAISYTWGRWKENIPSCRVIQEGYMLTWSAKWLGSDTIMSDSVHLHNTKEQLGKPHDREIVASIAALIDEADVLVYHNGENFDLPTIQARMAHHGLPPLHPTKSVDTLQVARKYFRFPSNRLGDLAQYLSVPHDKISTEFSLWAGCMEGDIASYERMIDYNAMDVQVLEEIYLRLRPYDRRHPNLALHGDLVKPACVCGCTNLSPTGKVVTTGVSVFDTYRCDDCGRVVRSRKNKLTKEQREQILMNVAGK